MELLKDGQIDQELAGSEWVRDGLQIKLACSFKDFTSAVAFINRVAELAEAENHHPDLKVHSYNQVEVTLSTHSAGGITDLDIKLADLITKVVNS